MAIPHILKIRSYQRGSAVGGKYEVTAETPPAGYLNVLDRSALYLYMMRGWQPGWVAGSSVNEWFT